MAPIFAVAASQFEPTVRFLKLDTEAEPSAAARHSIRSIPTMILFAKGQPIARQAGAMGLSAITDWLQRALPQQHTV
jgi:thioredoxin 2